MTSNGYPDEITRSEVANTQLLASIAFFLGVSSLMTIISLSGWTKSRRTGIITTILYSNFNITHLNNLKN